MQTANLKQLFGRNLVRYRKREKLTQEELAEICGVTTETISNIERGIHGPRFELLERICVALNVHPRDLFQPVRGDGSSPKA